MKRGPRLSELPAPPPGRTDWPWTVGSAEVIEEDGWPTISVVTPSFGQAGFIEETIRSVLLQRYPVEYFVLDGGSTDGTREILEKYAPWLAGWRCERDRGQSAAVNEGWQRATGELVAWINSDDWYQPGAFAAVARVAREKAGATWFAGYVDDHTMEGAFIKRHRARGMTLAELLGRHDYGFHQPGMFWRRSHQRAVGLLDETLHNSFDCDYWARSLRAGHALECVEAPVACFRRHRQSKTGGNLTRMLAEDRVVWERYAKELPPAERRQAERWLCAYEADRLPVSVYQLLAAGRRGAALGQLLRHARLLPYLRPARLYFGALWRVLVTGRPAPWFQQKT